MRIDLHIHSSYSPDGISDPKMIVRYAKKLGLEGIAIADHNQIKGSLIACSEGEKKDILVVKAIEVTSAQGHILGYGVSDRIKENMQVEETIETIRNLGGLAVAPHPFRFWSGLGRKNITSHTFDAIEAFNARCLAKNNKKSLALAQSLSVGVTGGSDAHRLNEIGRGITVLDLPYDDEGNLLEEIRKGKTRAEGDSRGLTDSIRYVKKSVSEWIQRGMNRI